MKKYIFSIKFRWLIFILIIFIFSGCGLYQQTQFFKGTPLPKDKIGILEVYIDSYLGIVEVDGKKLKLKNLYVTTAWSKTTGYLIYLSPGEHTISIGRWGAAEGSILLSFFVNEEHEYHLLAEEKKIGESKEKGILMGEKELFPYVFDATTKERVSKILSSAEIL